MVALLWTHTVPNIVVCFLEHEVSQFEQMAKLCVDMVIYFAKGARHLLSPIICGSSYHLALSTRGCMGTRSALWAAHLFTSNGSFRINLICLGSHTGVVIPSWQFDYGEGMSEGNSIYKHRCKSDYYSISLRTTFPWHRFLHWKLGFLIFYTKTKGDRLKTSVPFCIFFLCKSARPFFVQAFVFQHILSNNV